MLVLERLSQEDITINKEKSEFGESEVTYLGNVFSDRGISIDSKRAETIF